MGAKRTRDSARSFGRRIHCTLIAARPPQLSAVAIASLDDADADELAGSIKSVDGKHDRYDRTPEDIRLM
jgi:hypothetical protein